MIVSSVTSASTVRDAGFAGTRRPSRHRLIRIGVNNRDFRAAIGQLRTLEVDLPAPAWGVAILLYLAALFW